jgi:glycosyltransferase involved in cell wall biosynthesis
MKIILSAFACSPGQGSEEGVGWGVATGMAQRHRVHVLTTPRYQPAIERYCAAHPNENLTFSYHDLSPAVRRCIVHSALWQIYYYVWQRKIAGWAGACIREFDPDLIHHITYGRYWTPSSLSQLGKPFIWGPLGGGDRCPPEVRPSLSAAGRFSEFLRERAQAIARLDPALKATARHAAIALGGTDETGKALRTLGAPRVEVRLTNAVDVDFIAEESSAPRTGAIFCSIGRLLEWKGQALTIRAFAAAKIPGSRLIILGEGPTLSRLQRLTRKLRLNGTVEFLGNQPRETVREWVRKSVALVHPAVHDQAPTVVFEAMAVATPVIGLALGGITIQTTPQCAILITPLSIEQIVKELADAMRKIAGDRHLRHEMGLAGQQRLRAFFTWPSNVAALEQLYETLFRPSPTASPIALGSR